MKTANTLRMRPTILRPRWCWHPTCIPISQNGELAVQLINMSGCLWFYVHVLIRSAVAVATAAVEPGSNRESSTLTFQPSYSSLVSTALGFLLMNLTSLIDVHTHTHTHTHHTHLHTRTHNIVAVEDDIIQDFLWLDSCCKLADKVVLLLPLCD